MYGAATTFAWLSTYEGFGLPPLEAMAAGVPVVAYDTAVAREVYDAAAALVPVGRRRRRHRRARSPSPRIPGGATRTVRPGGCRLARFDWTRTAQATLAALREAAV